MNISKLVNNPGMMNVEYEKKMVKLLELDLKHIVRVDLTEGNKSIISKSIGNMDTVKKEKLELDILALGILAGRKKENILKDIKDRKDEQSNRILNIK